MQVIKKEMAWFKDWFNSPYYHLLYSNRNETEAENFIKNINNQLNFNPSKILDLACGKGRHSYTLNQLGHDVTGIDLSKESIKIAKLKENKTLKFHVHDMRKPFISNEYDLVVNLFTSFGYFEDKNDNLMTLKSVNFSLKHKGYFLQDYFNAEKVKKNIVPEQTIVINGVHFLIKKEINNNTLIKTIQIEDNNKIENYQEKVDLLNFEHFNDLYQQSNLNTIQTWGDYQLNEFDIETSDRLIILSQKQ